MCVHVWLCAVDRFEGAVIATDRTFDVLKHAGDCLMSGGHSL